jgi:hypothetical protein
MTDQAPDQLNDLIMARMTWKGHTTGANHPHLTQYDVVPEPGWPVGRKGMMFTRMWQQLAKPTSEGILINDGDCVIDGYDFTAMVWAVGQERDAVHAGPVRLWPKATGYPDWVWGHRHEPIPGAGLDVQMKDWQTDVDDPVMFSFNFTFIPRRLMEAAIKHGLEDQIFPHVDEFMWMVARDEGIPVRPVRYGCAPKHMNF